jgi:hypothetical protein
VTGTLKTFPGLGHLDRNDIPLAALANNMLNVRLDSLLALLFGGVCRLDANLRENFIDTVDITRVMCQQTSEALDEIHPEWSGVCERFALATGRVQVRAAPTYW